MSWDKKNPKMFRVHPKIGGTNRDMGSSCEGMTKILMASGDLAAACGDGHGNELETLLETLEI
jgi:hypothetical protein